MDQNITNVIGEYLDNDFIDMVISNPVSGTKLVKVKIRPIILKGELLYQATEYRGNQVFHKNCTKEELLEKLQDWLDDALKQVQMRTQYKLVTVLISKKGKATVKIKNINLKVGDYSNQKIQNILSHNREKTYIIEEGSPVPFLIDLGVMTADGKVVKARYDKFRQINRFLEFIEDILPDLNPDRELTIIDFGCGKSYLTFAMYYYLKELKGKSIQIIGLDLKKDVIKNCSELAHKYGYDKLKFLEGDIASFEGVDKVDMVVTLHACDTATDYALFKAIRWDADVILSVPCCQHELNTQLECEILKPMMKYGLIRERFAALATDALRAELLETAGYKSQILEFIDMEHTPKNILIRAVKKKQDNNKQIEDKRSAIEEFRKVLGVNPTLYQLLSEYDTNRLFH
jgi:SAM-dependent methyltransferase